MPKVIGIKFRTSARMYYFSPTEGDEFKKGDTVIVETQRGVEPAAVVMPVTEVGEDKIVAPLKSIMRKATEDDLAAVNMPAEQKQEILATAKQKVQARDLDMKIVDCEYTVDHSKLVLYFTAEQRVDFRELVRDLASAFHNRIDLRQIGAREECKLIGSLGACGLQCCCGRFESDSEHVSIKMAKCQNLALTPNKINGMCGRLLCCLSYENKTYEDVMRRSPKVGSWVTCPDGRRGTVSSVTPLTEKVRVRIGDEESFEFREFGLDEIKFEKPAQKQANGNNGNGENKDGSNGKNKQKDRNAKRDRKPDIQPAGNGNNNGAAANPENPKTPGNGGGKKHGHKHFNKKKGEKGEKRKNGEKANDKAQV